MRSAQELFKLKELSFIVEDLKTKDKKGVELYSKLMKNEFSDDKNLNPENLILVQIPPFLEQYTVFILNQATKSTFNRHLGWLASKMGIQKNTISESIFIDFIRYILIKVENPKFPKKPNSSGKSERVHRWLILGWLLKFIKSDMYKGLAKQALFFDWLYFDGNRSEYRRFEPCWLMIVNSLSKYKEMSEELLEFLFLYAKE